MRLRIFGRPAGMAAKPMIARSSSGNRLGTPWPRHLRAADAGKSRVRTAPRLMRRDQRGAEPVAGFLAGHQKDMRGRRAAHRAVPAGAPIDENIGVVGGRDQPFRLGDDGRAGHHGDAGKSGARHAVDRLRADRRQIEAPVLPGLGRLHQHAGAGRRADAAAARAVSATRSSIWSVPSAASTASTCLSATTTACPISNGPVARR